MATARVVTRLFFARILRSSAIRNRTIIINFHIFPPRFSISGMFASKLFQSSHQLNPGRLQADMKIRKVDKKTDYEDIWEIFSSVIQTGDTYVFDPTTPKEHFDKFWFGESIDTFVAIDENENVVGTYFIKPNQVGLGSHIANCGYMVHPACQGRGAGKLMCEHSIAFAKQKGYVGMQFNIVVSTNTNAVHLWKKFGFEIIGTTPKGFRHKQFGLVDTYIMFKPLE